MQDLCYCPAMVHPEVKKFFAQIARQGGEARAKKLSAKRRREIATKASRAAAKARMKKSAETG